MVELSPVANKILTEACTRLVLQAYLTNDEEVIPDMDAILHNLCVGGFDDRNVNFKPGKMCSPELKESLQSQETVTSLLHRVLDEMTGETNGS